MLDLINLHKIDGWICQCPLSFCAVSANSKHQQQENMIKEDNWIWGEETYGSYKPQIPFNLMGTELLLSMSFNLMGTEHLLSMSSKIIL